MYEDLEATTRRLIREDGTEWSVRELDLSGPPARALVVPREVEGDATAKARESFLARGDRLEWRRADGTVVWATRIPVTTEKDEAEGIPASAPSTEAA